MRFFPILATVAAAAALTFGSTQAAQAVIVTDPITSVAVTPVAPSQNSKLTTTIDFCVPNGTQEGDTFTLMLSRYLTDLPLGFSLDDPKTGVVVATAALSRTSPAVITFTMTPYAETHTSTCGTAFVTSNFDNTQVETGATVPLTSTTGFGTSFTTDITPTGVIGDRSSAIKYGVFTRPDEGKANPADFLTYHIGTPAGPFDSAVTTDVVPDRQSWRFDCTTLIFGDVTIDADDDYVSSGAATPDSFTCRDDSLTINWGAQVDRHFFEALISVSLPKATGSTADPAAFDNLARVTTNVGGVPTVYEAPASNVQSSAGGSGSGTAISAIPPVPAPTASPVPSASPVSPAPSASPVAPVASAPSPARAAAAAAATPAPAPSELAYTGTNAAPAAGIAAAVIALGASLVVVARRRRSSSSRS